MAKHEIAFAWNSQVDGTDDSVFDLTKLDDTPGNNITECLHNGKKLNGGFVHRLGIPNTGGHCFLLKLSQVEGTSLFQYFGIAFPTTNEFHNIMGVRIRRDLTRGPVPEMKGSTDAHGLSELLKLLDQDQGTWTGTQP